MQAFRARSLQVLYLVPVPGLLKEIAHPAVGAANFGTMSALRLCTSKLPRHRHYSSQGVSRPAIQATTKPYILFLPHARVVQLRLSRTRFPHAGKTTSVSYHACLRITIGVFSYLQRFWWDQLTCGPTAIWII